MMRPESIRLAFRLLSGTQRSIASPGSATRVSTGICHSHGLIAKQREANSA